MNLGFDDIAQLYYEGKSPNTGRGVYPHPVITPSAFPLGNADPISLLPDGYFVDDCKTIFREDSFDPVTRIRRGRFYTLKNKVRWTCKIHPNGEFGPEPYNGFVVKYLSTYEKVNLLAILPDILKKQSAIALGSKSTGTLWNIIGLEMITTGEELVTLKARSSLGSLPELIEHSIPEGDRGAILQAVDKLREDIFRASPESIIDHCRDCAERFLRSKIRTFESDFAGKELNELITKFKKLFEKEYRNIPNCAEIIRIHHQRRKTAIQDTTSVRSLMNQDADLCVYSLGSIICDLNWGRWI